MSDEKRAWLAGQRECADDHRAALTRALTAQAWGVACATFCDGHMTHSILFDVFNPGARDLTMDLAALPAPADLADEIVGAR